MYLPISIGGIVVIVLVLWLLGVVWRYAIDYFSRTSYGRVAGDSVGVQRTLRQQSKSHDKHWTRSSKHAMVFRNECWEQNAALSRSALERLILVAP